jgi:2-oxoisovalerate dehydrogenase E1 component
LYALAAAWDYLQGNPDANVLVLTSETMRQIVDIDDPDTSPIFGDAATATVLTTTLARPKGLAFLHRPVVSARGEGGAALRVPLRQAGAYVQMDGKKVFAEAVRRMGAALKGACALLHLTIDDLDLIVPHQANERIIDALRARLHLSPDPSMERSPLLRQHFFQLDTARADDNIAPRRFDQAAWPLLLRSGIHVRGSHY